MESNPYAAPTAAGHVDAVPPRLEPVPTPWERRAELGLRRALVDTTRALFARPGAVFDRMDWETSRGATLYYLLVTVPAVLVGMLLPRLWTDMEEQRALVRATTAALGEGASGLAGVLTFLMSDAFLALNVATTPVSMLLGLYGSAGVTHLALRAMGKASGGWTGTFKTFAYAAAPMVLCVVPSVGMLAGVCWWTVLQVIGLARAHRITVGAALGAVVAMHVAYMLVFGGIATYFIVQWVQQMVGDFGAMP